jgi:uncharacterized protein (TIGR03085 family)
MLASMTRALLARRERVALCDLALVLGEDAPTLCGDWTAKELVTHLLLREHSPLGATGMVLPPLSRLTDLEMARVGRKDFAVLVERLRRRGPTPLALRPLDKAFNTLEYFVHHEDLRRAQEGWEPRELAAADEDDLWRALRGYGRGLLRRAGVPVRVRRTDTGATATLRRGADPVVVSGRPSEIALFLFGRDENTGLGFEGPEDKVARLRESSRGF